MGEEIAPWFCPACKRVLQWGRAPKDVKDTVTAEHDIQTDEIRAWHDQCGERIPLSKRAT